MTLARSSLIFVILFQATALSLLGGAEARKITLGLSLSTLPAEENRSITGQDAKRGLQFFVEWINGKGGIVVANETVVFDVFFMEDFGDMNTMISNYNSLIANSSIDFLVGPVASDFAIEASLLTEAAGKVLVAWNAASDLFFQNKQMAYSLSPPSSMFSVPALLELRVNSQKKTIHIVTSTSPVHITTCENAVTLAEDYEVIVTAFDYIPESTTVLQLESLPNLTATVEAIIAADANMVLLCTYPPNAKYMIDLMKDRNYMPGMIVVNNMFSINFDGYENSEYIMGLTQWDSSARYASDKYFGTMANLRSQWTARFGMDISSPGAHAVYAGVVYMEALLAAQSFSQQAVDDAIARLDLNTLKGRLSWAGNHAQLGNSILVQYMNGSMTAVGPINAARTLSIYPAPRWDERQYIERLFSEPVEWGITTFTLLGLASNIGFFVFLLINWNHPVIRASSPLFLSLLLAGSSLLYAQTWVWMPSVVSTATCHLRIWMIALGFGLLFSPMLAKTFRIWKLYSNSSVGVFRITDLQLFIVIFVIMSVEIILATLLSSLSGLHSYLYVVDPLRPVYNYPTCSTSTSQVAIIAVIAGYNILLMIAGIYLAIRVRVIPYGMYNESKIIGFAIYNVSFFAILIAVLQIANVADRKTVYGVTSAFTIAGCLITTGMLFISKFFLMKSHEKKHSSAGSSRTTHNTLPPVVLSSIATITDPEILRAKYRQVKRELEAVRERLQLIGGGSSSDVLKEGRASDVLRMKKLAAVKDDSSSDTQEKDSGESESTTTNSK